MTTTTETSVLTSDQKTIKLDLVSMNIMTSWEYEKFDITKGLCGQCHNELMEPSLEGIKTENYENIIILCKCNHWFHEECFKKTPGISCPIDKTPWITARRINPMDEKSEIIRIRKINNLVKVI